ncbi:MAG: hypothetical protein HC828_21110 [Blastochloris sp.]|nr:hypothetical protein [Blastochloris sp.]
MPTPHADTTPLTLVLIGYDPPPATHDDQVMDFGAQDKAGTLHPGTAAPDGTVRFRMDVAVRRQDDRLDFAGPFVHGPRQGRFLYLGYRPVEATAWTRRWKIPLAGITPALVATAQASGHALQATFSTHKAATVQLRGPGWEWVQQVELNATS